jgi:cellulose biosynthesis protein BcsQ
MKRIKHHLNPKLKIVGILLTMFDKRTNLSHQVAEDAERYFKHLVFKTMVPRNVRLGEAPSFGKPILLYDRFCRHSGESRNLVNSITSGCRIKSGMTVLGLFTKPSRLMNS